MAETKPTTVPEWNTDGSNRTTPNGGKIATGWVANEKPVSSSVMNWLQHWEGRWTKWLNERLFDGADEKSFTVRAPAAVSGSAGALLLKGGVPLSGAGGTATLEGGSATTTGAGGATTTVGGTAAGSDQLGGDGVLSGGISTGASFSKAILKAAQKGAGGTGQRTPTAYLTADGDLERVDCAKPLKAVSGDVAQAGVHGRHTADDVVAGVLGDGGPTAHGLYAIADLTSPKRSALRVEPQDADPTTRGTGDHWANSSKGTIPRYETKQGAVGAVTVAASKTGTPDSGNAAEQVLTNGTVTIPTNSLWVGAIIEFAIHGVAFNNDAALQRDVALRVRHGGLTGSLIGTLTSKPIDGGAAHNRRWSFTGRGIVTALGGAGVGTIKWWMDGVAIVDSPGDTENLNVRQITTEATNAAKDLVVTHDWVVTDADTTCEVESFIVKVYGQ